MTEGEVDEVKQVAEGLLDRIKEKIREYHNWKEQEGSRDSIKQTIRDYLYDDSTGLPGPTYSSEEALKLAEEVYKHVYRVYPSVPSPYYQPTESVNV
jgi:type I restriction enzyme R subunit